MGYLKGLLTTIGITYPSYLFIHIYLEQETVATYFRTLFGGQWLRLMEVCNVALMEPLAAFFSSPIDVWRVVFAYLPWVVAAFVVNFFFRKRARARGGISTAATVYLAVGLIYQFAILKETLSLNMFTEANPFYAIVLINVLTLLIGLLASIISPFRGEKARVEPVEDLDRTTPYYMPTSSPSRDQYLMNQQPAVEKKGPKACEYCGSFIDADSQYCSVCGSQVSRSDDY